MYEKEQDGELYNTALFIDPNGKIIGKYRKNSIPLVKIRRDHRDREVLLPARQPRLPRLAHRDRRQRSARSSATTATSRRARGRSRSAAAT